MGFEGILDDILFIYFPLLRCFPWAIISNKTSRNPPAMQETWIRSLCWEDPLEKQMVTHSSILVWRISWTEEHGHLDMTEKVTFSHFFANCIPVTLVSAFVLEFLCTYKGKKIQGKERTYEHPNCRNSKCLFLFWKPFRFKINSTIRDNMDEPRGNDIKENKP